MRPDERAQLLMTIPGVGPMTATALLSTMGDPGVFRNGRECAAWIGLIPRQHSTGGKERLLGIDRGDRCRRSRWLQGLLERRHRNVATVALASGVHAPPGRSSDRAPRMKGIMCLPWGRHMGDREPGSRPRMTLRHHR